MILKYKVAMAYSGFQVVHMSKQLNTFKFSLTNSTLTIIGHLMFILLAILWLNTPLHWVAKSCLIPVLQNIGVKNYIFTNGFRRIM